MAGESGGSLPDALRMAFTHTSRSAALDAIQRYTLLPACMGLRVPPCADTTSKVWRRMSDMAEDGLHRHPWRCRTPFKRVSCCPKSPAHTHHARTHQVRELSYASTYTAKHKTR